MNTLRISSLADTTRSQLATVSLKSPLMQAARLLAEPRIDLVVVCHPDGTVAGVVTKTDIVEQIGRCVGSACQTLACDLMAPQVVRCRTDDLISDVLALMERHRLVHLPVVDEQDRPVGIVNARDALRALVQEGAYEESLLREYVMGIGYH